MYTPLLKEYLAPFTNAIKLVLCEFESCSNQKSFADCRAYHEELYTNLFSNIPEHVSLHLSEILIVMEHNDTHVSEYIVEGFISGFFKFYRLQHVYKSKTCQAQFVDFLF
jgi:hypothetical protein